VRSLSPTGQRTTNAWDGESRLTQMSLPSGAVDNFTYNGDGRRVQKVDSAGTTKYVWDGQNVLLETNVGNVVQAVHTLEPRLYGNQVSQRRGTTSSYYHFDALGSTLGLTGSAGTATDSYVYRAFGELVASSGTTSNPYRYVGRLGYSYDVDLANYHVRARRYDPPSGRWWSRDPIGFGGGDENLYRYVFNSPTSFTDPFGEAIKREWVDAGRGWRYGIDRGPEIFGGFEIHVYRNGKEVVKIKGSGGYCKTHGGEPLLSPSEFRKQYGDDAYKQLKQEVRQRTKQAKSVGWTKGLGTATVLLTFLIDGYAEALEIAVKDDSAYRKCVGALSRGDMPEAQRQADEFYFELLTGGAGAAPALHWRRAWDAAVRDALDNSD